jgi:hypothetical protein
VCRPHASSRSNDHGNAVLAGHPPCKDVTAQAISTVDSARLSAGNLEWRDDKVTVRITAGLPASHGAPVRLRPPVAAPGADLTDIVRPYVTN